MTIFKDSHHFSRTLGSLWWQSLRTAITSAELWAVFDDNLSRQPSLQQNFRQCLITMFNDSAFFERTLRGRFRENISTVNTKHIYRIITHSIVKCKSSTNNNALDHHWIQQSRGRSTKPQNDTNKTHLSYNNPFHCKLQKFKKMNNATTKPITGADAAALLSGRSPINFSMMLSLRSELRIPPPSRFAIGSFKNRAMSTTAGFPSLLLLCNNGLNWDCNQLLRSSTACCIKSARSCST